jgi:hypothetical protein
MNRSRDRSCKGRPVDKRDSMHIVRRQAEKLTRVRQKRAANIGVRRVGLFNRNRSGFHRHRRVDASQRFASLLPAWARTCRNASSMDRFAIRVSRFSTTASSARTTSSTSSIVMRVKRVGARTSARSDPVLQCVPLKSARHLIVRDDIKPHNLRLKSTFRLLQARRGAAETSTASIRAKADSILGPSVGGPKLINKLESLSRIESTGSGTFLAHPACYPIKFEQRTCYRPVGAAKGVRNDDRKWHAKACGRSVIFLARVRPLHCLGAGNCQRCQTGLPGRFPT